MTADTTLINETFAGLRRKLAALLTDLEALASAAGGADVTETVAGLRETISRPFLFVVVGEIKAGKSSFINALLVADICPVDPAPCTDAIHEIVYAAEPTHTRVGPHMLRIGLPVAILQDIAIVDTPGTNTVIAHHQEITQRFIPNSGLVLFVFPAKNPHTRSAWELLETVSDQWRKKVVFVLQQADLATEKELAVNTAKVGEYARQRGITAPLIFATSAVREAGGQDGSGFGALRRFIREKVTGGRHMVLKLRAILDTSEALFEKTAAAIAAAQAKLQADRELNSQISRELAASHAETRQKADALVIEALAHYDECAGRLRRQLATGLSLTAFFRRSVGATIGLKQGLGDWLDGLQKDFTQALHPGLAAMLLRAESLIRTEMETCIKALCAALDKMDGANPRPDGLSLDFWRHRHEAIESIQTNINTLLSQAVVPEHLAAMPEQAGAGVVGGSAMTLIGTLMLATTHITVLDITGGVLAGAGLILTASVLVAKRGKIIKALEDNLTAGKEQLGRELQVLLSDRIGGAFARLADQLQPLNAFIAEREAGLADLDEKGQLVGRGFAGLSAAVDQARAMIA